MSAELEELKRQRREIDEKIRILKSGNPVICGNVKFELCQYPGFKKDDYKVYAYVDIVNGKSRWMPIIVSEDKQTTIDGIQPIIDNLTMLLEKLKVGKDNGK